MAINAARASLLGTQAAVMRPATHARETHTSIEELAREISTPTTCTARDATSGATVGRILANGVGQGLGRNFQGFEHSFWLGIIWVQAAPCSGPMDDATRVSSAMASRLERKGAQETGGNALLAGKKHGEGKLSWPDGRSYTGKCLLVCARDGRLLSDLAGERPVGQWSAAWRRHRCYCKRSVPNPPSCGYRCFDGWQVSRGNRNGSMATSSAGSRFFHHSPC